MDQVLSELAGQQASVIFTPHLVPMDRGILVSVYAQPKRRLPEQELFEIYNEYYRSAPFVRVRSELPRSKDTTGTNFFDVAVRIVRGRVLVFGCLDNLIKGAAGTALQNFNLMFNLPETAGLL